MDAAERLFRSHQFHEIKLDQVAAEAGIGKGTIYLYFTDKNDLFFQTAIAGFDGLCDLIRTHATGELSFREELLQICCTIADYFQQRRPLFRMILHEGNRAATTGGTLRERWQRQRRQLSQALAEVLSRGVATGAIRADLPAEALAEYLLGLLRTRSWELEDAPESSRTPAVVVDLFLHGASGAPCT